MGCCGGGRGQHPCMGWGPSRLLAAHSRGCVENGPPRVMSEMWAQGLHPQSSSPWVPAGEGQRLAAGLGGAGTGRGPQAAQRSRSDPQ